jgi:hypothetical protein
MQGREAGHGGMWLAGFLSAKLIQQGEEVTRERIEANEIFRSDKYFMSNVIYKLLTHVR